jgi:hypothetical protein
MLGFFGNNTLSGVKSVLSDKLSIAKTRFDATGVSGAFANAKSVLSDVLSESLKNPTNLAEIAKTQIKEIEGFLTTETETKLNAFIENHTNVETVIKAFNVNIKSLTGDTNRSVECSYYETYEDIGNNKITKSSLTLSEAKEKRALQKTYCDKLFQDNATELLVISNHLQTIGKNINSLLQNISENRDNTNTVNELTPLRSKLLKYNGDLLKYIIVFKCGENGIQGLFPSKRLVGGGSYKKTKGYKKINALNRGMRGCGVEEEIKELEAFFGKQKGLEVLLQKRIALDVVLDNLYKNTLGLAFDKSGICEYYESYEDIGITKRRLTLSESNAQDKYNLQIGFRDSLIEEIEEIKAGISKEEIDGIIIKYKDYKASSEKLFNDISVIDNPQSFTGSVKSLFGVTSDSLKEQKKKLLKFLKQLEYLFETKSKYIKIENLKPIINPHIQVGGGSYKKTNKKNILGKERCIYKKSGDRKEYIKYKGNFIAVREYKKLLKTR